jgi:hypothetical protein
MKRICGFVLVTVVLGFVMISLSSGTTAAFQISPTRTPVPTLTAPEQEEIRAYALQVIETAFGFEHPRFQEIVDNLSEPNLRSIRERGMSGITVFTTWFDGYTYMVGSVHPYWIISVRIDPNGNVQDVPFPMDFPFYYGAYKSFNREAGFADRNGNGLPEIPIWGWNGGNCCPSVMSVAELHPEIGYVRITPYIHKEPTEPNGIYLIGFYDLEQDGILEIQSMSPVTHDAGIIRWFAWDGWAYVEVTADHEDWYLEHIQLILNSLGYGSHSRSYTGCVGVPWIQTSSGDIHQALLDYYMIGRLDEGWAKIRRLTNWTACREYLRRNHEKYDLLDVISFENWVRDLYTRPFPQIQ